MLRNPLASEHCFYLYCFCPSMISILSLFGSISGLCTFSSQSCGAISSIETEIASCGQPHSSRNTALILSTTRFFVSSSLGYALILIYGIVFLLIRKGLRRKMFSRRRRFSFQGISLRPAGRVRNSKRPLRTSQDLPLPLCIFQVRAR